MASSSRSPPSGYAMESSHPPLPHASEDNSHRHRSHKNNVVNRDGDDDVGDDENQVNGGGNPNATSSSRSSSPPAAAAAAARKRSPASPPPPRRRYRSRSRSPATSPSPDRHRRRSRSRSPRGHRLSPQRRHSSPRERYSSRRSSPPKYRTRRGRSPFRRKPWSPPRNRNNGVGEPGNNLFVAGFHFVTTERDLERKFSKYGRVTDCRIVRDKRSGESRGFGFLTLERDEDADAAIEALDQIEWNGRIVLVEKAKTTTRF